MIGSALRDLATAYGKLGVLIDDAPDANSRLARQIYGTEVLPNWWVHAQTVAAGLALLQALAEVEIQKGRVIAVVDRFLPSKNPRGRKRAWDRDHDKAAPDLNVHFRVACAALRDRLPSDHTFFVTSYPYEGRRTDVPPAPTPEPLVGDAPAPPVLATPTFGWRHRGGRPLHRFARNLTLDSELLRFGPASDRESEWHAMIEDVAAQLRAHHAPVLVLAAESAIRTRANSPGLPPPKTREPVEALPRDPGPLDHLHCAGWYAARPQPGPPPFVPLAKLRRQQSDAAAEEEARRLRAHDFGFPQHLWLAARLPWGTVVNTCRDRCFRRGVRAAAAGDDDGFDIARIRAFERRWDLEKGPDLVARTFETTAHTDARWESSNWRTRSKTLDQALRQALNGFETPRTLVWCGNTWDVESTNIQDLGDADVRVVLIRRSPTGALAQGTEEFERVDVFDHEPHAFFHDVTVEFLRQREGQRLERAAPDPAAPASPAEDAARMPRLWRAMLALQDQGHDQQSRAWGVLRATEVIFRLNIALLCADLVARGSLEQRTHVVRKWSGLFERSSGNPSLYVLWEALRHAAKATLLVDKDAIDPSMHPLPRRIAQLVRNEEIHRAVEAARQIRNRIAHPQSITDPSQLCDLQMAVLEPLSDTLCADGDTWRLVHHNGVRALEETDLGGWRVRPAFRGGTEGPVSDWLWLVGSSGHTYHLAPWVMMSDERIWIACDLRPVPDKDMQVFDGRENRVVPCRVDRLSGPIRRFLEHLENARRAK